MQIKETKDVWLTMTNDDPTEGRGRSRILHVCETEETARRLGKRNYVMGSDCPVEKSVAVKIGYRWLVPGDIQPENEADKKLRIAKEERQRVIGKMRDAGFSDEDIAALGQ